MGSIEEALKAADAEDDLQTILRVLEDKSVSFKRCCWPLCKHGHINVNWLERQNAYRRNEGTAAATTSR